MVASSMASVLASRASTPSKIDARHHQSGQHRGAARNEGERGPIGQQHRADCADQRRHAIEPDRGQRVALAERVGGVDHARPAASRCQPASCSGPRPGIGCRHNRPVSTICLVAWANRASSRSSGGIENSPGRNASSATTQARPRPGREMHGEVNHGRRPLARQDAPTAAGGCRHALPEPGGL